MLFILYAAFSVWLREVILSEGRRSEYLSVSSSSASSPPQMDDALCDMGNRKLIQLESRDRSETVGRQFMRRVRLSTMEPKRE